MASETPIRSLGISAYYHDSAAALVSDSLIIAAAQEERFTRVKFDSAFPVHSIRFCLKQMGCGLLDLDQIVFYDKPFLKFDRLLETYLAFAPRGFSSFQKALPAWLKEKLFLKQLLIDELSELVPERDKKTVRKKIKEKLRFSDHHLSHAASAFYPSPFQEAAVLVLDGVGEWATASLFMGEGKDLRVMKEIRFPHSLGLLYSAFTDYCGFKVNSGEYKLMGLAPYGSPIYADVIKSELVHIASDGSFRLNMKYFDYCTGLKMTHSNFDRLFGGHPRGEGDEMTKHHMDMAASVQNVTEEILLKLTRQIAADYPTKNLCLAGGVALNCVANGKILREGCFEKIWVQPAAGDAGGALGAALVGVHLGEGRDRKPLKGDSMKGAFLGPEYGTEEIRKQLDLAGARYQYLEDETLLALSARLLEQGKVLAWFQGRMEFGPRSLGARSILGDPRSEKMQSVVNQKIKFRESFRPFAPAILREDLEGWFKLNVDSPYMMLVADSTQKLPAVTHVDGSARVQTVHRDLHPLFHELISRFKEKTGCPVVLNTSFNVRGEPIVNTPTEAYRCFMATDLDALAVGQFLMLKEDQNPALLKQYHQSLKD